MSAMSWNVVFNSLHVVVVLLVTQSIVTHPAFVLVVWVIATLTLATLVSLLLGNRPLSLLARSQRYMAVTHAADGVCVALFAVSNWWPLAVLYVVNIVGTHAVWYTANRPE